MYARKFVLFGLEIQQIYVEIPEFSIKSKPQPPHMLFSRESDSRIANVRLSVPHKNPSASQNSYYQLNH